MKTGDTYMDEFERLKKLPKVEFTAKYNKLSSEIKFDSKNNEIILPMAGTPQIVKMIDAIKIAEFILKHA